jgi:hypothetical protein
MIATRLASSLLCLLVMAGVCSNAQGRLSDKDIEN